MSPACCVFFDAFELDDTAVPLLVPNVKSFVKSGSITHAFAARSAANTARSAATRETQSSTINPPMISPSGVITTIASGCVRKDACVVSARAVIATRASRAFGKPRLHSVTKTRIALSGCEIGIEGRASATARRKEAHDNGAMAPPARRGKRGVSLGNSLPGFLAVSFSVLVVVFVSSPRWRCPISGRVVFDVTTGATDCFFVLPLPSKASRATTASKVTRAAICASSFSSGTAFDAT